MKSTPPSIQTYRQPALIFNNGIGDHILSLPTIRAFAKRLHAKLRLICHTGRRDVFFSSLENVTIFETVFSRLPSGRKFDALIVADWLGDCDLLVSLNPWTSPAMDKLLARLSPSLSVGFFDHFDIQIPLNHETHAADQAFRTIAALDDQAGPIEDYAYPLALTSRARRTAETAGARLPADAIILVIHSDTHPDKMWGGPNFQALLDDILARRPKLYVWFIGLNEGQLASNHWPSRVLDYRGLSLQESFALIERCHIFLGVDSCMLHAADLFRTPSIGLFGPTDSREFGFRFTTQSTALVGSTMSSISVNRVCTALEKMLGQLSE